MTLKDKLYDKVTTLLDILSSTAKKIILIPAYYPVYDLKEFN